MKSFFAVPLVAVALIAFSPLAMAAGTGTTQHAKNSSTAAAARCTALEGQFDAAFPAHQNAPKAAAAKSLRGEAEKACAAHNYASGIRQLRLALKDIGVAPKPSK